jgi:hypothetical protein
MTDPGVSDPKQRLAQILRAEAGTADDASDEEAAGRLDRLADTIADMTPAERTWVREASDDELREFARTLRTGCAPEPSADHGGQTAHGGGQT